MERSSCGGVCGEGLLSKTVVTVVDLVPRDFRVQEGYECMKVRGFGTD